METWFIILISICISAFIKSIFNLLFTTRKPSYSLPPGSSTFPIIHNFLWLRKSSSQLEHSLRSIHAKFGPIVTLWIGFRPAIFIADRALAHQALIQNGAAFANRPKPLVTNKSFNISSAFYGPMWRLLRRNLTYEILHPSRMKSYSHARNWSQYKSGDPVYVLKHFQYAMFCLLVLMCFGDKLESKQIKRIEDVHRGLLLNIGRFNILNVWPRVTKIIFHKRWKELLQVRRKQGEVLIPLIRSRRNIREENSSKVKQEKDGNASPSCTFSTTSRVTEDVVLNGCLVPKNGTLNFMVAEIGWDSTVWEDPMAFKPERFLSSHEKGGEAFDITGSREIKMMPFGVGRRICPGLALAMLHLEYFVANLVWQFEWTAVHGDDVDLSERQEFTTFDIYLSEP
ncbi:hypothetical protein SCA6_002675 [Theobroma cacao]